MGGRGTSSTSSKTEKVTSKNYKKWGNTVATVKNSKDVKKIISTLENQIKNNIFAPGTFRGEKYVGKLIKMGGKEKTYVVIRQLQNGKNRYGKLSTVSGVSKWYNTGTGLARRGLSEKGWDDYRG